MIFIKFMISMCIGVCYTTNSKIHVCNIVTAALRTKAQIRQNFRSDHKKRFFFAQTFKMLIIPTFHKIFCMRFPSIYSVSDFTLIYSLPYLITIFFLLRYYDPQMVSMRQISRLSKIYFEINKISSESIKRFHATNIPLYFNKNRFSSTNLHVQTYTV